MNKSDAMFFYIEEVRKLDNSLNNLLIEWKKDAFPIKNVE